jgi:hypothetical protein
VGADPNGLGLEVAVAHWGGHGSPTAALRSLHAARLGRRAIPLVVIGYDAEDRAWLLGPDPAILPVGPVSTSLAARLVQAALDEPSSGNARRRLLHATRALQDSEVPGLLSAGLFATHELVRNVPKRSDWDGATAAARDVLTTRPSGIDLIRALGWDPQTIPGNAFLLSSGSEPPTAVAIFLREEEGFEQEGTRFSKSPIYHGLELARGRNVRWLVIARGPELRLFPTLPEVGVGRRGATQTYFGLDLSLLGETQAGYLTLTFGAEALAPGGTVDQILRASRDHAVALEHSLRDRIYRRVMPTLAEAVARAMAEVDSLNSERLKLAYRLSLRVLFRLLFQAYAEDTGLLPLHQNEQFTRHSLKTHAHDFADHPDAKPDARSTAYWDGLRQVWHVIDGGNAAWGVPAYDGGLFRTEGVGAAEGAAIEGLRLTDDVMGPVLSGLLVDDATEGTTGPVDFRSLDVRDFGTIYEGLLEAGLSVADTDVVVEPAGLFRPAHSGEPADVAAGESYFHTKSGDRKATGSYFTPSFIVEHLLERALDPVLDAHLERVAETLATGDQVGAARQLFDFRVADLAMGSGHFLVAALGHIEQKFGAFLEGHQVPGVERELADLQRAASTALEEAGASAEIDRSSLLGRQIAKRCLYGVDMNELAVELARLAIWVRTFVPGLPMSSLDHQLVHGNSLTGIGTIEEAIFALDPTARPDALTFTGAAIRAELERARVLLEDAAALKEATSAESRIASEGYQQAMDAAGPAKELLDAAVAVRLGLMPPPAAFDASGLRRAAKSAGATEAVESLNPAQFPALFPEVFLRETAGFDVLVGNPPWEKAKVEEHAWWSVRFPGLRSMRARDRLARIAQLRIERPDLQAEYEADVAEKDAQRRLLVLGDFPGIGSGDPDLYQAFAWRNWRLLRAKGRAGLVLPRGAHSGSALSQWRRAVLHEGAFEDVAFGINTGHWMFDMEPRYTIGLTVVSKGGPTGATFSGPFHSYSEFEAGRQAQVHAIAEELESWSDTAAFPLIPTPEGAEIFRLMRRQPRFDSTDGFEFRPTTELHSTANRAFYERSGSGDAYIASGATFSIWEPDYAEPAGGAMRRRVETFLEERLSRQRRLERSPFFALSDQALEPPPWQKPRIVFRDTARATDSRTVIACLMPPGVFLDERGPYLIRARGSAHDEAFLLGVLNSIPLDWYARRFVELHVKYYLLNAIPIPRPEVGSVIRRRVEEIAGTLSAKDERYRDWAAEVGVPVGSVSDSDRGELLAELDALSGLLFGLSRSQLKHVFETFHRGWHFEPRLRAVLRHFDRWKTER